MKLYVVDYDYEYRYCEDVFEDVFLRGSNRETKDLCVGCALVLGLFILVGVLL